MTISAKPKQAKSSFNKAWTEDLVRALWLGLSGRADDLEQYLKRTLPKWKDEAPDLTNSLYDLMAQVSQNGGGSPVRRAASINDFRDHAMQNYASTSTSVTSDLLRFENPVLMPVEPVWSPDIAFELNSIIRERLATAELAKAGLRPTNTIIFTGLPGVGKTLAARWLAQKMGLPLAVLNLGAVMSSFLGRTGANLRQVLSYASEQKCVLLLDELDAIAKRRDDDSDIGELKRLVTVLLQELDAWPSNALLIAATNHENLIDPAVWRRFERRIIFPLPSAEQQAMLLKRLLGEDWEALPIKMQISLSVAFANISPADLTQIALRVKRDMIIDPGSFEAKLVSHLGASIAALPLTTRKKVGIDLKRLKLGQREINRLTGLARETIRGFGNK